MKKLFFVIVAFLFCLTLSAQDRMTDNTDFSGFDADTATNADTVDFTYPNMLDGLYYYSWQIVADSLTGTTGGTCYVQESNDRAGTAYSNVSGKSVSFSLLYSDTLLVGTAYGARQRVRCITTGTQSTQLRAWPAYKKINGK